MFMALKFLQTRCLAIVITCVFYNRLIFVHLTLVVSATQIRRYSLTNGPLRQQDTVVRYNRTLIKTILCTCTCIHNRHLTLGMPELQAMVGMTTTVGGVSAQHGHARHGPARPRQPGLAYAHQPLRRVYYGLLVVDK